MDVPNAAVRRRGLCPDAWKQVAWMIKLNNVTFTYRSETGGGIREIDLSIPDGQVVVLCGESGCGKTTLTRLINGLIPHYFEGELSGSVEIDGKNVSVQPLWDTARQAGSVFQNPRSQFFNVDTTSEITFGCENLGMPRADILARLERTVPALKLEKLLDRSIFELSGGEKQKIACASAFMMEPQVFVLDEPSANLDADAILDLREVIAYLKSLGKTIVLSEHRLYYLRGIADRYLYMSAIPHPFPAGRSSGLLSRRQWRQSVLYCSLTSRRAALTTVTCCKPRSCSNSCAEAAALPTLLRTIRS